MMFYVALAAVVGAGAAFAVVSGVMLWITDIAGAERDSGFSCPVCGIAHLEPGE